MKPKYIYAVKKIFEDKNSQTFSIAIIDDKTSNIASPIGIFNLPIPQHYNDTKVRVVIEKYLDKLTKFREKNQKRIDKEFTKIVSKF